MILILGATPGSNWQAVIPMLEQLGATALGEDAVVRWKANPGANITPASSNADGASLLAIGEAVTDVNLTEHVVKTKDGRALLLHDRPETALARAMQAGRNPVEELDEWRSAVENLLQAYRRNRRAIRMMSADAAVQAPDAFATACKEHLGLTRGKAFPPQRPDEEIESIYRLLAAQMVAQADEIQPLLQELEASSIPLGVDYAPARLDCQAIYEELGESASRPNELEEENELLLLQLHQVQEELESYFLELQDESGKQKALNEKYKALDERLAAHKQLLEEKERQFQKLLAEKKRRDQKIVAIRKSTSWRLTMPIRVIRRLVTGKPLKAGAE